MTGRISAGKGKMAASGELSFGSSDAGTEPTRFAGFGPTLHPGTVLGGRYRLLERIGKGGMGVVFRAEHLALGCPVAIKAVRADLAESEAHQQRLIKESRMFAAIRHENVARIFDYGTSEGGQPYLVLEYVEGSSLAELLVSQGPFYPERAARLMLAAARAVQQAHRSGVVHRDLKPHNMMVEQRGDGEEVLKILDFGIARRSDPVEESEATLTNDAVAGGTPHYMAPEVARGTTSGRAAVDVYALGAVLYELLSGRRVHEGASRNAIVYSILSKRPARLDTLVNDLPLALTDLVHRCLAAEPDARPTALAVARELEALLADWKRGEPLEQLPRRASPWLAGRWGLMFAAPILLVAGWLGGSWWQANAASALVDKAAAPAATNQVEPPKRSDEPAARPASASAPARLEKGLRPSSSKPVAIAPAPATQKQPARAPRAEPPRRPAQVPAVEAKAPLDPPPRPRPEHLSGFETENPYE